MIATTGTVAALKRDSAWKLNGMDVAERAVQRVAGGFALRVGGIYVVDAIRTAEERNGSGAAQHGQSNHGEVGIPGASNSNIYPLDILTDPYWRDVRHQRGSGKDLAVARRR